MAQPSFAGVGAGGPLAIELVMKRSVGVDTILDNFHGSLRDNVSAAEWAQLSVEPQRKSSVAEAQETSSRAPRRSAQRSS
mgnify:CR=1 FL=1